MPPDDADYFSVDEARALIGAMASPGKIAKLYKIAEAICFNTGLARLKGNGREAACDLLHDTMLALAKPPGEEGRIKWWRHEPPDEQFCTCLKRRALTEKRAILKHRRREGTPLDDWQDEVDDFGFPPRANLAALADRDDPELLLIARQSAAPYIEREKLERKAADLLSAGDPEVLELIRLQHQSPRLRGEALRKLTGWNKTKFATVCKRLRRRKNTVQPIGAGQ